jgi:hypothetical protein
MSAQEATGVLVEKRRRVRWATLQEPLLYGGAAASYIAVGTVFTPIVLFWGLGFAWLLLWVCGIPALIRRFAR